jgi:hypothetical protein
MPGQVHKSFSPPLLSNTESRDSLGAVIRGMIECAISEIVFRLPCLDVCGYSVFDIIHNTSPRHPASILVQSAPSRLRSRMWYRPPSVTPDSSVVALGTKTEASKKAGTFVPGKYFPDMVAGTEVPLGQWLVS